MKLPNTIFFATALVLLSTACSQQGEGERCLTSNKDADCESGLICTPANILHEYELSHEYAADRCCPDPHLRTSTDSRCKRKTSKTEPAATGGTYTGTSSTYAGTAGADSEAGGAAGVPGN